jgi:hypothetical protein
MDQQASANDENKSHLYLGAAIAGIAVGALTYAGTTWMIKRCLFPLQTGCGCGAAAPNPELGQPSPVMHNPSVGLLATSDPRLALDVTSKTDSCTNNNQSSPAALAKCTGPGMMSDELVIISPQSNSPVTVRQVPSGLYFTQTFGDSSTRKPTKGAIVYTQAGGTSSPLTAQILPSRSKLGAFRHVLVSTLPSTKERVARQASKLPLTTEQNHIDYIGLNGKGARAYILAKGGFWITSIPAASR